MAYLIKETVQIKECTQVALHNVNLDNCYKQALHLIDQGFRYWFNNEEIKNINQNNEQYQIKSPEEEFLLTWFEKADKETANAFLNAT